jgi:hypothetical protein
MHALYLVVEVDNEQEAVQSLARDVIPMVRQTAGFASGTWFGDDRSGHALLLFDTEDQARQAAPPVGTAMPGGSVLSADIYPVTGQA